MGIDFSLKKAARYFAQVCRVNPDDVVGVVKGESCRRRRGVNAESCGCRRGVKGESCRRRRGDEG